MTYIIDHIWTKMRCKKEREKDINYICYITMYKLRRCKDLAHTGRQEI